MIPYGDSFFFYILFLLLIPAVLLGLLKRRIKYYGIFAGLIMLFLFFGKSRQQSAYLVGFYLAELLLVKVYGLLRKKIHKGWLLWMMLVLSITPLAVSKYGNLFTGRELGFLGISYLTFKAVQILIEIHDGLISNVKVIDFTYFLLFFPTLSSGPIDRSRRFLEDAERGMSTRDYVELLGEGLWKLVLGVGYKFIAAYFISSYWMDKIPKAHTLLLTLDYMYAYSFYLFFDFAGYSLIAIGASYILGIRTPDNFNKPFLSKDIKDFWNRWHMTLSFWFRDFIYTRFVMTALRKKWFKNRYVPSYFGYVITMGTMGIWHGTEIYYLAYGLYHGILIVLTDIFQRKSKLYKKYRNNPVWNAASVFVTFNLICFGFLIFSGYLFRK